MTNNSFKFQNKEELIKFIQNEIVDTTEAIEILECSRQNLNNLVKRGVVVPIKEFSKSKIFFKEDILKRKNKN